MMETRVVYVTNWGEVQYDDLPPEIRRPLMASRFTRSGAPDRRSKYSVEAWQALEQWMLDRWTKERARYSIGLNRAEK